MGDVIYKQQKDENDSEFLPSKFSHKQIVNAWRELPEKKRLIVFLVDFRKLGIERTAEIMNIPVSSILKEVRQARTSVKRKLVSYYQSAGTKREFFR